MLTSYTKHGRQTTNVLSTFATNRSGRDPSKSWAWRVFLGNSTPLVVDEDGTASLLDSNLLNNSLGTSLISTTCIQETVLTLLDLDSQTNPSKKKERGGGEKKERAIVLLCCVI